AVEQGLVTLIGATTENPSFEVISALLSRSQTYILNPIDKTDLIALVHTAIENDVVLKELKIEVKDYEALLRVSGGDARKLLNLIELIVNSADTPVVITNDLVLKLVQQNMALYDKSGEQHYD